MYIFYFVFIFVTSCSRGGDEKLVQGGENDVVKIQMRSHYGDGEITDLRTISHVLNWLRSGKELKTNFASYPNPEMILVLIQKSGDARNVRVSYPGETNLPVVAEQGGRYFYLQSHPDIPEFQFYRSLLSNQNLLRNEIRSVD